MKKEVLGRGLEALLSADLKESVSETERVKELDIESIEANPHQPREHFNDEHLGELAESIKKHGVLQPVVVRRAGDRYQLVIGERRLRASKMAGRPTIPAIVREIGDEDSLKFALLENLQREDLTPVEEARGYAALRDEFGITVKEVAGMLGKDRSTVANTLRLLKLPVRVIEMLEQGKLTAGHARAILSIEGEAGQIEWAERVVLQGFTVREIEEAAPAKKARKKRRRQADPQIAAVEERAELRFGTRVKITPRRRGGVISIEYYSTEELEAILEKMGVDTEM
ncbi:MAG: ParB/RepB/Spo0J family partition protein [Candidatus Krumholzibacteria bacterium]|nr:ParB/RepB/Spo0J family partition protein [Candidatus Krumholzibacteria bacterium]